MKFPLNFLAAGLALLFASLAHAAPSLSITGVSPGVLSGRPGDAVTFTITISNSAATGNAANDYLGTNAATVALALDSNTATTVNFAAVNGISIPAIAAGGSATIQISRTVPTQTSEAADYYITATITNAASPIASFRTPAPSFTVVGKPDLELTSLSYPASTSYEGANIIPMSLTWRNRTSTDGVYNVPYVPNRNGNGWYFRIDVVLSSNPTFGDADDFLLTSFDIDTREVADGLDRPIAWSQQLPGNFAGTYYVMAKIDSTSQVAEVIDDDITRNGNNTWYNPDVNGARITLLPTNFPTIYWASTNGNRYSDNPSISADGRYLAFASDATNLSTGDTNGARDIFIYDNQTSLIRRLSLSQQGAQANSGSATPSLSADGAYVAFSSDATNLVLGDSNGFSDIFVVNTLTGAISRDSISSTGGQSNGSSYKPSISGDGRYVVFESSATNLVATGTAVGVRNVYLRDRTAGTTVLVSQSSGGVAGNANSLEPAISSDGRYVVFSSDATNLVSGDTNAVRDIYLRDLAAGTTVRVSVATGGTEANGPSHAPSISQDGGYIAFGSEASNLVSGDTNGVSDVFVCNRAAGSTVRVSVSSAGAQATDPSAVGMKLGSVNPSISATGRYVTFASLADNLTAGDRLGEAKASDWNDSVDVFVMDRDVSGSGTFDRPGNIETSMVSKNRFGYQTAQLLGLPSTAASDIYAVISADGRWVGLPSDAENTAGLVHGATNRTSPDTNTFRDVFLYDRRINAIPNPSNLPVVTITSPGANPVLVNTAVAITASATTTTGVVSKVEFFVNGTSVGSSSVFPYTQTWTPTAVGTYVLSATVTDSFGNFGVSPNVSVRVNAAPSVGITTPGTGSTLALGTAQTITATASATTPGAMITSVQILANGTSLATLAAAPYTVSWTPTATGNYALTAVATDSNGTITTSPVVAVTVSTSGGPVTGPAVALTAPSPGASYTVGASIRLAASVSLTNGLVQGVEFFANGVSVGSKSSAPFTTTFVPNAVGVYSFTAVATDTAGNMTTSSAISVSVVAATAPTVAITSPQDGTTMQVNLAQSITATVAAASGTSSIVSVSYFANNLPVGSATSYPFSITWTPTAPGIYSFTAVATDSLGTQSTSAPVTYVVSGGAPPAVAITTPANNASIAAGVPITIRATASDSDGTVARVQFLANGIPLGTASTAPYSVAWTPTAGGSYTLTARATDNAGNVTTSTPVAVTVGSNSLPVVSITGPQVGTTVVVGAATLIMASALDADGIITGVQFYANGVSIGSDNVPPYSVSWTPSAEGYYNLTAVATDNANAAVSSAPVLVRTALASSGAVDATASGMYVNFNTTASGEFTMINLQGKSATMIGYVPASQTTTAAKTYFLTDIPVDAAGKFEATDSSGAVIASGQFSATGVSGSFKDDANSVSLAGLNATAAPNGSAAGYYQGSISDHAGSAVVAIIAVDGSITIYARDGAFTDAGKANVDSSGSFNFVTRSRTRFTGRADSVTGLLTGSLERADAGRSTFTAAQASGSLFSDGVLRNLSTRGQVGTGDGVLVAGFVINSSTPKHVLIRAVGPGLIAQGVTGALANPSLTLHRVGTPNVLIGTNDNWGGDPTIAGVAAQFGAFALPGGSLDAALYTSLSSGAYIATVSGVGGTTGIAMLELYDADSWQAFSAEKLINISSRGQVGSGTQMLVAGFVVNGSAPKKVLIRGVGPALAAIGLTNAIGDPKVRLNRYVNGSWVLVRENDNWEMGNDPALIRTATAKIGATPPLAVGSLDAALLLVLPPGVYTAEVAGANGGTGVGLLEVYEVQ